MSAVLECRERLFETSLSPSALAEADNAMLRGFRDSVTAAGSKAAAVAVRIVTRSVCELGSGSGAAGGMVSKPLVRPSYPSPRQRVTIVVTDAGLYWVAGRHPSLCRACVGHVGIAHHTSLKRNRTDCTRRRR